MKQLINSATIALSLLLFLLVSYSCEEDVYSWDCIGGSCLKYHDDSAPFNSEGSCMQYCTSNTGSSGGSTSGGSTSGGGTQCDYTQWSGTLNCANEGYYAFSETHCCPKDAPYSTHASDCNHCYATCEGARNGCSGPVYRANTSGVGGSSSGGSSGSTSSGSTSSGGTSSGGTSSGGSTSGSTSSGGSSTSSSGGGAGQLTVWSSNSQPCPAGAGNTISVYINGSYVGGLNQYFTSAPNCGNPGTITKNLAPGTYSVSAECGSNTWSPKTIQVNSGSCSRFQLY